MFDVVGVFSILKGIWNSNRVFMVLFLMVVFSFFGVSSLQSAKHRTDWFHDAKWGIMTHYLATPDISVKDWNSKVDSFDVKGLARQLKSVGAGYYMVTIGQMSGYYCAPNSKYEYHTGISPSKCSSRDLVNSLYNELSPLGIKLMVYLPATAPALDAVAVSKLGWVSGQSNKEFQVKWESVIREWSLRWGGKVKGWWFDGVYWPKEMYESKQAPNFQSFAAAAKTGNPDSIIAFNPGPKFPLVSLSDYEDYTAGEVYDARGINCDKRWIKNSQLHILSYLGSDWGVGKARYNNKQVINITHNVNKCEGVVTWDVPIQPNGRISQPFIDQLIALKSGIENKNTIEASKLSLPGNVAAHKKARLLDPSGVKDLPVSLTKHFPGQGVDGDLKTFALAANSWAWIYQIDLEKAYLIKRMSVTFGPTFATEYRILYSLDGSSWFTLKYERKSHGGKYNYKFLRTKMRYIRIHSLKPDAINQPGTQMSIAELEAYQ